MKTWAFAITVAFFAAVSVAAGAVAVTDDGGDGNGRAARDADDRGESGGDGSAADCATPTCVDSGGGPAASCLEGAVDCDDTPTEKPSEGDVCIKMLPTTPECADPDAPVSNDPSPTEKPPASDVCIDIFPTPPECIAACTLEYPNECSGKAAALADLAARMGVNEDAITIVSVERVDWPDACLGVSQPDVACAEVITTGYRIILETNGQEFEYHTDGGSRAVLVK